MNDMIGLADHIDGKLVNAFIFAMHDCGTAQIPKTFFDLIKCI